MAKITIIIEGAAMCYLPDDKIWRVIFPFDNCHKVTYRPDGPDGIDLAQANRVIDVEVNNGKKISSEGAWFKKFFNLTEKTDYETHINGIKPKTGWQNYGVLLKIPNAVISRFEETKSRYQLKLNGQFKKNLNKIGYSVQAEIELKRGGYVKINVPGHANFPKVFNYADGDKTIKFDNDCDQETEINDLNLLYDYIIEDKTTSTKKFAVDRHPADMPFTIASNFSHNPDPTESGLPCYVVRVDNTTGLP